MILGFTSSNSETTHKREAGAQEAIALNLGNGALLGRPVCLIPPEGEIGNLKVDGSSLGLAYADANKLHKELYLVSISLDSLDEPGSPVECNGPKLIHTFKGELAGGGSLIPEGTFGEDSPGGLLFARMTRDWDYDIFFSDLIGYEVKLPRVNSRRGERSPILDPDAGHLYLASQAFAPESKFISYNLFRWDLAQIGLELEPQSYASSSSSSSEEASSESSLASSSSSQSVSSSSSSSAPTSSSSSSESSAGGVTSISANLIARWEFDGDYKDSAGNGNNDGVPLQYGDKKLSFDSDDSKQGTKSLRFPGGAVNGARVKVGNINLGRAFTICGWCKVEAPDHKSKNMRLFSNRGDAGNSEGLDISINVWENVDEPDTLTEYGDRRISVTYYKNGGYEGDNQASDVTTPENIEFVTYNTWAYFAVSIDLDNLKVSIYFDDKSHTGALKYNDFRLDRPWYIGGAHNSFNPNLDSEGDDSGTYFYKGLLDDFRIYDQALSKGEIDFLAGR